MIRARLRGTATGLSLSLAEAGTFAEASECLAAALVERKGFLVGALITLDCGALSLTYEQVAGLVSDCQDAGVQLQAVQSTNPAVLALIEELGLARKETAQKQEKNSNTSRADQISPLVNEGECGLIFGTVRSGHAISHPGTVIIFGDVNPGAEIIAGGSIIVWGALRGTVHAGAGGDDNAVVCALNLAATILRIGAYIGRAPDEPMHLPGPEMAKVEDGGIVLQAWGGKRVLAKNNSNGLHMPGGVRRLMAKVARGVERWGE